MKHKKAPLRTTDRVEKWFNPRDTFRLILRIIAHVQVTVLPSNHVAAIGKLQEVQVEQISLQLTG
jgi:hypothetical protein